MNLYPKNILSVNEVKKFIVIFYAVGTLGFVISYTKHFFIVLTPFALLLNIYLLALYNEIYTIKSIIVFVVIFSFAFIIEVIGVNTGLVFGEYDYGKGLGFKVFNTPVLVGLNWLFLTYTSNSVVRSFNLNKTVALFVTPLVMCVYDVVLEQVAPKIGMWEWKNDLVPLQNYLAWYLIGLGFLYLFQVFKINTKNSLSKIILVSQFLFFVFIMLILG